MTLTSRAFQQGGTIPKKHTCDGDNISPPFAWSGVPEGTRSFVLLCDDPSAPSGIFHHWAAYDIPSDWRRLAEGHGPESLADGFKQAINDLEQPGYTGPCPPSVDKPHDYHFCLYALSEPTLPVASSANCEEVIIVARPYVLERVELVGLYGR
jgi:hypothetical protein